MTQILVAESQEKALKNVTVISHKFLVPLSWDGPHAWIGPRDGLQAWGLAWSMLSAECWSSNEVTTVTSTATIM